jgi:hypothetical protein
MNIIGLGVDRNGKLLFGAQDENAVAEALVAAIERNASAVKSLTRATAEAVTYRREAKRAIRDPGDPRVAGWTFLVNADDPRLDSAREILRPLAEHRGMANPGRPLVYRSESRDRVYEWLHEEYYSLALKEGRAPQYILLVGDPQRVPFEFQSVLATVANVGRVDFDSLDQLQVYVDKLLRLETAPDPVVEREAVFFAPDHGYPDPTYFSRKYMAEPLAARVEDKLGLASRTIFGPEATKQELTSALRAGRPALVYTASHGLGAIHEPADVQRQVNGAICCQSAGPPTSESLFSADDVPHDQPFLEGTIFFQFACFGYGTPAESDYAHWLDGVSTRYTENDFVAALPRKLLSHPRGPIAYIGHLDTAFLHAFADPKAPHILDRWHTRIAPFVMAVDELLGVQPSGLALHDMNVRYGICNGLITSTYDRQRRGRFTWTPESKTQFLDQWISRGDAQNYMVLGDPAARLRMPD